MLKYCSFLLLVTQLLCADMAKKEVYTALVRRYLHPFARGISKRQLDKTEKTSWKIGRYLIKNNRLFVRGRSSGAIESLLLHLVRTRKLPDLEFLYLHAPAAEREFPGPVFCQCKRKGLRTPLPFHDRMSFWIDSPPRGKFNWHHIYAEINANQLPWSERANTLIWRGGCSDRSDRYAEGILQGPRGVLCALSFCYPELIDARFSSEPKSIEARYNAARVSIAEQLRHKFHIIMHGRTGTFPGTRWRLLSGALCFFCDFDRAPAWYFPLLSPHTHFIPIDSQKLDTLPQYLRELTTPDGDKQAKRIAANARRFALEHLTPESIETFCLLFLKKYAALYTDKVRVDSSYRPIDSRDQLRQW